jgi:Cof subfamily protein (haloacid dehalogenase superfamily)
MYKLIAADMDGTLLNDNNEITSAVGEAIKKARAKGLIFTLATGRAYQGVEKYVDVLEDDIPVISCNGAVIITSRTKRIIHSESMSYENTMTLLKDGLGYGAVVAIWADGRLYSSQNGGEYSRFYQAMTGMEGLELSKLPKAEVTKMVWVMDTDKVLEHQKNYVLPEGVQTKSSGERYLEFFSAKAGKDKGLKILADRFGIDMSEVMAVGDNYNDIEMLRAAGLGVAMGNAPDEVKAAADAVTDTNNADGLAKAIERHVFGADAL